MNEAAARVLLVYGYEPSGHAAAAFALETALRARGRDVTRVEVASDHHPLAGLAVAHGYHALLRRAPAVWGALYESGWSQRLLSGVRRAYLELGGARKLRGRVVRERAGVVVCPQAAVAAVFAVARQKGRLSIPVVSVLTDFDVHPHWLSPPADFILAPNAAAARRLVIGGVAEERIQVVGIPIHPAFAAPTPRAKARQILGLPALDPVVLLSGGSQGYGGIDRAARKIRSLEPRARLLVLCGADDDLRRALSENSLASRLSAFGPERPEFVALLLAAADVHVTKAGGLTIAESLAMGVPLILANQFPGQERVNAETLVEFGAAAVGRNPEDCGRLAAGLLHNPVQRSLMAAAAARHGIPDSAARAARALEGDLTASFRPRISCGCST